LGQKPLTSDEEYKVVINHEEQYSIWPIDKKASNGWKDTRMKGDLGKCQKYIEGVWTDMRPLSIRKMKLPDNTPYMVVVNHEEQYSIWPVDKTLPRRWKSAGFKGKLYPCVKYIKKVWTDMRPLSIQK
jgi:MbtH protein